MKRLLAHPVERVIFINIHRPISWEYYINQKFAKDVARWPQTELIDWDVWRTVNRAGLCETRLTWAITGAKLTLQPFKINWTQAT